MDTEKPKFFNIGPLIMHYRVWGEGPYALIAFHGFGRTNRDFRRFTKKIEDRFTIYAFDIFFHGESNIGQRSVDEEPWQPEELKVFFEGFLNHIEAPKAWIMGYSLGGRLAMKIAEVMPERIGGLYLFAPDGLILNRWYAILSHTIAGRKLFRFFMKNNPTFFSLLSRLNRAGFISNRLRDFILYQVQSPEMQMTVYRVWTFLRKIEPDFSKLGRALRAFEISVDLFFGHYDKIIPKKNARKLQKHYPEAKIHVLRTGHTILTAASAEIIHKEKLLQLPKR